MTRRKQTRDSLYTPRLIRIVVPERSQVHVDLIVRNLETLKQGVNP